MASLRSLLWKSSVFLCSFLQSAETSFFACDLRTGELIAAQGSDAPVSPCSTFKVPLALIGFDSGVLQHADAPEWPYQEEYAAEREVCRMPQTPRTWMALSCVWYSQQLAQKIGLEALSSYISAFGYGNRDLSGGLVSFWLGSSLQISPTGQLGFLRSMLLGELPVSSQALALTKELLLLEEHDGWRFFGKTGAGEGGDPAWLVGWVEFGEKTCLYALAVRGSERPISRAERIAIVKKLLPVVEIGT